MLSEQFRKRIGKGKYTSWATELTEDNLEALLWAVGEYGYRAGEPLRVLHEHLHTTYPGDVRALLALEVIAGFVRGEPTTLEPLFERIRQAMTDAGQ